MVQSTTSKQSRVFSLCRKVRRIRSTIVGGKNENECEIPVISRPLVFFFSKQIQTSLMMVTWRQLS